MNILLVEDDPDDQMFFREALDKINPEHSLTILPECTGIINIMNENKKFDIIFMDINLPAIDGKTCLKSLKANPAYANIPVVMFTVSQSKQDIDTVYETGAHYYLIKPYATMNFVASLKIIFDVNWKVPQPIPDKNNFVINLAFN